MRNTIDATSVAAVQIVWLMSYLFRQSELQCVIKSQSLRLTTSENVDPAKKMTHKMELKDEGYLRVVRFVEDGCVIGSLEQDSIVALHSVFDVGTTQEVKFPYVPQVLTYIGLKRIVSWLQRVVIMMV